MIVRVCTFDTLITAKFSDPRFHVWLHVNVMQAVGGGDVKVGVAVFKTIVMISVMCRICRLLNRYNLCGIIWVAAGFEVVVMVC